MSRNMVNKNFLFLFALILLTPLISASRVPTEPIIKTDSQWEITHTTDYDFTPYLADAKDKKTTIGLIPNSGSCSGLPATKRLYDELGNEILDDKNKPIDLKCESSKCAGQNCYSISLTDASVS